MIRSCFPAPDTIEDLKIFTGEVGSSSPSFPLALSEDAHNLLLDDHMPMLERFYLLVMGNRLDGFASTPSGFAQQL